MQRLFIVFFSSRRRHTRYWRDWSSDVCSSDLHADLGAVEVTILDEADHMADLGFLPGVKRLLDRTPKVGQRLLFSATLDNGVDVLVKRYLSHPTTHSVDPAVAPVSTMTHHVFRVDAADKPQIVKELASGLGRTVMFTRTKHQAKKLAKQLTAAGVPAVDRKSTRLNSSHANISYAVFCLKKKKEV